MLKYVISIGLMFNASFALAQQASPEVQAIQSKLSEEYNQNLQLRAALIKEQMKVKELEAKIENDKKAELKK